jgi:hypothetical protein
MHRHSVQNEFVKRALLKKPQMGQNRVKFQVFVEKGGHPYEMPVLHPHLSPVSVPIYLEE